MLSSSTKAEQFYLCHFFKYLRNQGDLERTNYIKMFFLQKPFKIGAAKIAALLLR